MNIFSLCLPFLFILVTGTFYLIFKDYIIRNKLSLAECFKMYLDFFVTYCMLGLGFVVASKIMIEGVTEMESRNDRALLILTAAILFAVLIVYAVGYLRDRLEDNYSGVVREEVKRSVSFGQVILFVGEIVLMLSPFVLIPRALLYYTDDKTFMYDLITAIICTIIGMFLFYFENPFREKLEKEIEIVPCKKNVKKMK